jgi:tetratricopeptide (TPR) repeat protein
MSGGPSFIGFEPEEKAKAMKTLNKVIELKEKNRTAAEESRGFEIAEEDKYAKRFQPIVDAISTASGEILKYTNEKDVKFAAREVIDAVQQLKATAAQAANDPTNQGYIALAVAYRYQALFAQAKLNFLDAAEAYVKAAAGTTRQTALGVLQQARDNYATALSDFQSVQIPIGFKQTVSIQQPPDANSVFPGANLQISPQPQAPSTPAPALVAKQPPTGPPAPVPAPGAPPGRSPPTRSGP